MSLKIMVDSSSGISVGEGKEIGVDVFPLKIAFGEQEYADGVDLTLENFYDRLLNGKEFPKTSLPNLYAIEKQIARYKEEGHTILILPLAKELSGTYAALKEYEKASQVRVVDTRTTIGGLRILVEEAKKRESLPLEDLVHHLEALGNRIRILAGIDTLEYLYKGGRLSKTASLVGEFIGLKPIITVTDGRVALLSKKHGRKKAMRSIADRLNEAIIDEEFPIYGIYSYDAENVRILEGMIDEKRQKQIARMENIAPVIASHVGPYAYGFVYVERE